MKINKIISGILIGTLIISLPAFAEKGGKGGGKGGNGGGNGGGGSGADYEYSLACGNSGNEVATTQATLLIGGADAGAAGEVEATQWLVNHAIGGDYLVLRVGGTGGQAGWMCDTFGGQLGSAAELSIDTVSGANDPVVLSYIDDAEIIFIAGGDQNQYEDLWKGAGVQDALNSHLNLQRSPIAGTSAGLAILGESYYTPANSGALSKEILDDPYHVNADDINTGDFLQHPQLNDVITDTHLDRVTGKGRKAETRHGRTLGFLARTVIDNNDLNQKAIGVEEGTFVAIDEFATAKVFGEGRAFFMSANAFPETIISGLPLVWDNEANAVQVFEIQGSAVGTGNFDLGSWSGSGGSETVWYTSEGYAGFNCQTGC